MCPVYLCLSVCLSDCLSINIFDDQHPCLSRVVFLDPIFRRSFIKYSSLLFLLSLLPITPIIKIPEFDPGSAINRGSISGQLVLVQSLFAQLCAPLDHVGQHFRDCVSAAEDLRDLETLKRVLTIDKKNEKKDNRNGKNEKKIEQEYKLNKDKDIKNTINKKHNNNNLIIQNDQINSNNNDDDSYTKSVPRVLRQFGGENAWLTYPKRLEIKNLIFSYTSQGSINSNSFDFKPILNNISFSIPPGGYSLGIVGPSGKIKF